MGVSRLINNNLQAYLTSYVSTSLSLESFCVMSKGRQCTGNHAKAL